MLSCIIILHHITNRIAINIDVAERTQSSLLILATKSISIKPNLVDLINALGISNR